MFLDCKPLLGFTAVERTLVLNVSQYYDADLSTG